MLSRCAVRSLLASLLRPCREEIEKQRAKERYMKLQEQGKTEQAKKDLGEDSRGTGDGRA